MAGIEQRNGRFNVIFRFQGKRIVRSLNTSDEGVALRRRDEIQETIDLVKRGKLIVPPQADLITYLMTGGKVSTLPNVPTSISLSAIVDQFFEKLPSGSLEQSTVKLMRLHCRHLVRLLGKSFPIHQFSHEVLQTYTMKRAKDRIRGKTASGATIKKELVTLRSIWKWATDNDLVDVEFPTQRLRLPKSKELPPFQTWEEIERQIASGGSPELWDALYLDMESLAELLAHVRNTITLPCMYPMFAVAIYTGARRSELLRCELSDVDLVANMLTIRERKRVRGKTSTRRVPIAATLKAILQDWLKVHPGSNYTFCHFGRIPWSRSKGDHCGPISPHQASHYFNQTLKGSKWSVLKGWHCFRHSFISNAASKGIDQRMIDSWVGHTTEAVKARYRHLFPNSQQEAMKVLTGESLMAT